MSIRESKFFRTLYYLLWRLFLFISRLLKSLWLFFPGILFIVLAMWCFWSLNQGKDIIVAFTENHQAKAFFFIAIAFWIYVSWYSARVVAYLKKSKQEDRITKIIDGYPPGETTKKLSNAQLFELPPLWLHTFPHIIGFACLLVIELAVLQSPVLGTDAIASGKATWFFFLGMIISSGLDSMVRDFAGKNIRLARIIFYALLAIFLLAAILVISNPKGSILALLWVLLLLHAVFLLYINLRKEGVVKITPSLLTRAMYTVMDFLRIPRMETGYFAWFNIVCGAGLITYLMAIRSIEISWQLGPFPFVLLAFAVLLGFGNMLTAFSVKISINLHFIIFVVALLMGSNESHYVRTKRFDTAAQHGIYNQRQDVHTYFKNWIADRGAEIDSAKSSYPVYFVLANGGASRSGYWTASVLGKLEDATARNKQPFSRHVFCLSGTSGGGVGVATFFSLLYERKKMSQEVEVSYLRSARLFLKKDFLTHTLAHMLGPDYFKYIFHISNDDLSDRAGALEETIEAGARTVNDTLKAAMDEPFSKMLALRNQPYSLPVLCINTTRMQDGNPAVVTNIRLNREIFNNREDVMDVLNDTLDMRLSTASILGARFPYISPAGRVDEWLPRKIRVQEKDSMLIHYFVDGGYFDNSGAGVVQEMMRTMLNYADTTKDAQLRQRVRKLHFTVLHITNSPVGVAPLVSVSPLSNDLASPILTVLGAYDMQTTVNDKRLMNFVTDIDRDSVCRSAEYYPIHLYLDRLEKQKAIQEAKKRGEAFQETPYAMNWFISDTTLKRMDNRLLQQPKLQALITRMVAN
jgi:predicted acylesterase/phospholipase RssA